MVTANKTQVGIMVKIRVYRKKEKRRETAGIVLPLLLFFVLFPYIISGFSGVKKQTVSQKETLGQVWVLEKKVWGMQKIPLEEYLIGMLAATIPAEYESETLKAQAIILRSFCMNQMKKENGRKVIYDDLIKEYYLQSSQYEEIWEGNTELHLKKLKEAIEETKGMILVCNGDIAELPFCRMSNGKTRDITEYTIPEDACSYMKVVTCEEDKMAPEYIQYREISIKEFERKLREILPEKNIKLQKLTVYRDNNDYVREIQIGEEVIDGERFRKKFEFVSSDYSLEKINDVIEIRTKGMGHGFGFSQYEANELAKKEKDYMYLLQYFFDNVSFEKL